ncbi:MAG: cytochrome P450 [Deltaproteobacteria bacterium]|nr:cytochrome P450 [Deltaproteobacteria bacterium]
MNPFAALQRGIEHVLDVVTRAMLTRTRTVGALLLLIFVGSVAMLPSLRFSEGLESFYDRAHPRQRVLEAVEEEFVHGRWLFITIEVDDRIFSSPRLEQIRALTLALESRTAKNERGDDVEAVDDVLSLTSVKDVEGGDQYFRTVALVPEAIPADAPALAALERRARQNPLINDNLVGADGKHAGLVVRLHDKLHEDTVAHLVEDVRDLLATTSTAHPGLRFFMTGMPAVERDTPWITKLDTVKFTPLMLGFAAVVIFFSVRRIKGVILVMSGISLASLAAIACFPLTGSSYNPLCSVLLPLVTIECVSFSLHYLIEAGKAMQRFPTQDVREQVMRALIKPTIMCWLTTAIGFGSLAFTKTAAIREFGVVMAVALAAGGVIIPLCIAFAWGLAPPEQFVSLRGEAVGQRFTGLMSRYLILLEKKAWAVIAVAVAISIFFVVGATRMTVGESDIGYFQKDHPVHAGALVMQQHLGGTNPIIVSIRAPRRDGEDSGRLVDPIELKKIEALQKFLVDECGVDRVTSVVDWIKVMNRAFLSLPPEQLVIPETRQQVAQLLLINTDSRIREVIDPDNTWARIVARTPEHSTAALNPIFQKIERYLAEHFAAAAGYDANITGESVIFALNCETNSQTQAFGLMSSSLATLLMLVVLFRSARVGIYAIPANAFPILVTLGTMGWLGIELSVATSMISSITIGFVVDDTIHFIEHYRERIETHGNTRLAIEEAYQTKGPGTVFTCIIFTVGFAIFSLSALVPLQHFGILAATAMLLGGIGELTIGPCLLLLTRSNLGAKPKPVDDDEVLLEVFGQRAQPIATMSSAVHTREPTMVDVLRSRADREPERKAFGYVTDDKHDDGSDVEIDIHYGDLDLRARALAQMLIDRGLKDQPVVLIYPPGIDYIVAVYACFYAGALAVPAYPPDPTRLQRSLPRLQTIISNAGAKTLLTTSMIASMREPVVELAKELDQLEWLSTDTIDAGDVRTAASLWRDPNRARGDIAFLQYTSGSTAEPKGVVLSHGNLMHNLACIRAHARLGPDAIGVSWLPPYHDMGLIGFILEPVHCGGAAVHLSPLRFLADPFSWLSALTRHRGWISAAPNFAFDLCARKITEEQKASLDLRHWKMALNGAEPVRAPTLQRFARAFEGCGFDEASFRPVYGLAEGSLLVSFPRVDRSTRVLRVSPRGLREDKVEKVSEFETATVLVGCGSAVGGQQLLVVDPLTRRPLPEGRVGELWIHGPSIARGYWKNEGETQNAFGASLDLPASHTAVIPPLGPWMRTGDLGFVDDDAVFIAGRLKDLIVIRGRNHYPQDIELTVEQCHPGIRPGCTAAFATDEDTVPILGGRLVVCCELDRRKMAGVEPTVVVDAIRRAVSADHELHAQVIVLVPAGALPKTSSGKIQRRACRAAWSEGSLDVILQSEGGSSSSSSKLPSLTRSLLMSLAPAAREAQLMAHLQQLVCTALGLPEKDVPVDRPLYTLGLDSMAAVQLKAEIEAVTGTALPLADTLQGPSIEELARTALQPFAPIDADGIGAAPVKKAVVVDSRQAPGPVGDALVGSLPELQADPFAFLLLLRRRYGEVVRLRLGPWIGHLLTQPEHVQRVLKDDATLFIKASNYDNQARLIGQGLITVEGEEWKAQRAAGVPAFHGRELARFSDEVLPAVVKDVVAELASKEGVAVDVAVLTKRLTLRAISEALFGHDLRDRLDDVLKALEGASRWGWDDMSAFLSGTPAAERGRQLAVHVAVLDDVLFQIIDAGVPANTLLAHLEKDCRERFPDADVARQQLRDQMLTYLLAGHDTTAAALTFALLALADHKEVDARVAVEARSIEALTYASVGTLRFTQAVVREVLRLWPPAWFFTRQATVDVEFGEWRVPAGSLVLLSPFVTHRDPFLWPDPTAFKPERFLGDDVETTGVRSAPRPEGAYFPFGAGARSCIGSGLALAELRLVLCGLLRTFTFERTQTTPTALASRVTLTPAEPPMLIVRRRPS